MKTHLFSVLSMIFFASSALALPTTWHRILKTTQNCKTTASFWVLKDSPFAYLSINSREEIPMHQTLFVPPSEDHRTVATYKSIQRREGLEGLPTYELRLPSIMMSSLPTLTISYSGVQYECVMEFL